MSDSDYSLPIIVTLDDLLSFVKSKCVTERVDFEDSEFGDRCGCLMVQYGKAIGLDFMTCTVSFWMDSDYDTTATLSYEAGSFQKYAHFYCPNGEFREAVNYGEVRMAIRQNFGIDL